MNRPPALRLTGIAKRFGGAVALKGIDWTVEAGEVHCLVGENGCGKSTLIKIVAGVHPPESGGVIELHGRRYDRLDPAAARAAGVQVIFQDLSLFPNLTVAENIAIADIADGLLSPAPRRQMRAKAAATLKRLGLQLDLDAQVGALSIAERQIVAICRGLAAEARLLFMDEPTASLTRAEVDALLAVVGRLKADGIAVVFVSHRLDEVVEIADQVTVVRDGAKVGTWPAHELDEHRISELMTGTTIRHQLAPPRPLTGRPRLAIEGLSRAGAYHDISFEIGAGEVVGLIGLLGAGRTELALSLFGMAPPDHGTVRIDGAAVDLSRNSRAIAAGIAYVSEDRLNLGLNLRQSVADNLVLATLGELKGGCGLISPKRKTALVTSWIDRLRIKVADPSLPVSALSGGNQQRVVLAKWLATGPKLLILDSPTVGVDIGNKAAIYGLIRELAAEGVAILLISDEIPEVFYNCDRVLHMRGGRILDRVVPGEIADTGLKALIHG